MIPASGDRNRDKSGTAEMVRTYLEARDRVSAEAALSELLAKRAEPLIQAIVRSKLGHSRFANSADVEDVCSETVIALIGRLEEFRNETRKEPLTDFEAFVSVIAYRACSGFFRRSQPEIHRLRNRLRYLLETQTGLAVWEDERGAWWCGLEPWRGRQDESMANRSSLGEKVTAGPLAPAEPVAAVTHVLRLAGGPVPFDELAQVMAEIWNVPTGRAELVPDQIICAAPSTQARLEQRQWVERLWHEIRELPSRQRSALLLNLHDGAGESVTTLLAVTRVASVGDLAHALEMTIEAFAAIWKDLPWSDLRISGLLGITRQQVINLRKSARERLTRRILGRNADFAAVRGNTEGLSAT